MITAEGNRICDKEIWSGTKKMWCGCRNPATTNSTSKYVCAGLDFCKKHALKIVAETPTVECLA